MSADKPLTECCLCCNLNIQSNPMRIPGSGVSFYAPSRWQRHTLIQWSLCNSLNNTPASSSWNFCSIIMYHFMVKLDQCACSLFLKSFTDEACTTCTGRLFHKFTIRCMKNVSWCYIWRSSWSFPLVRILEENCNAGKPFLLLYLLVSAYTFLSYHLCAF